MTRVQVDDKEKRRLLSLHDEFKQLIDVGSSDEEGNEGEEDAEEEKKGEGDDVIMNGAGNESIDGNFSANNHDQSMQHSMSTTAPLTRQE